MAKKTSGQEFADALGAPTEPVDVAPVENPVVESTPVAEIQQPVNPPAEPAVDPFLERVKGLGFQDVESADQARERLFQDYETKIQQMERMSRELEEREYFARLGQQYAAHLQDPSFANQVAQRQEPPKEETKPWWNPPKFDPHLASRWRINTIDEKGTPITTWKPDTPVEIRAAHDQYNAYVEEWSDKLVHRPHEVFPQIIEQYALPLVERIIEERFGAVQTQSKLEQVREEIESQPWMWEVDPRTNGRLTDPVTGRPMLSAMGQQVVQDLRAIRERGIDDPEVQWEYARNRAFYGYAQQQAQQLQQVPNPAQPAQPQATTADRNKQYLQQAAARSSTPPQRTGAIDPNNGTGKRSGRRQSPGHDLVAEMASQGVNI